MWIAINIVDIITITGIVVTIVISFLNYKLTQKNNKQILKLKSSYISQKETLAEFKGYIKEYLSHLHIINIMTPLDSNNTNEERRMRGYRSLSNLEATGNMVTFSMNPENIYHDDTKSLLKKCTGSANVLYYYGSNSMIDMSEIISLHTDETNTIENRDTYFALNAEQSRREKKYKESIDDFQKRRKELIEILHKYLTEEQTSLKTL